jgi:hypothetical protein
MSEQSARQERIDREADHTALREALSQGPTEECPNGRHTWPPDYSDGDTCNCGMFYLFVHSDERGPRVVASAPGERT